MRVGILGPLLAERDGSPLPVGGARLRALLARLALDPCAVVPAGTLLGDLWPDAPPADPGHALQSLVSRLRRALGDPALVAQEGPGYRLALASDDLDVARFRAAAAAGDTATALAAWRGPALADLRDAVDWAARAADRLEAERRDVVVAHAGAALDAGRAAEVLGVLEQATAEAPLDERLAALQVRALHAAGRGADALAAYERARAALDEELGALPSAPLRDAHAAALAGPAPAAAAPSPAATPATADAPSHVALRGNLPTAVTELLGRGREVAQALELLATQRLVTLVGPGGAGKTRLACEVALRRSDEQRDGAWLVELAPVADGADVPDAVLAALNRREARLPDRRAPVVVGEAVDRLVDALRDDDLLVVLDNCEHVVEDAAALADQLLRRLPGVRLLATSREPLGIPGEHLVDVGPLGLPEPAATPADAGAEPAVALLVERARAAQPAFALDEATVGPVVELCRRLDGLPLALELAAARLRTLPPAQLVARLDDRFRLLTGGSRAALPRQRTLRAVVDWSWDLLEEPERALARRVAVFNAGISPSDAVAVCAGDGVHPDDVLPGLAALADRSLLQLVGEREGEPRYRMLETLREYGVERMAEAGELGRVRTAHARHHLALAEAAEDRLRGPEQVTWFRRLSLRRDDLLAALRRLAEEGDAARALRLVNALFYQWVLTTAPEEAMAALRIALAVPDPEGTAHPVDRLVARTVLTMGEVQERRDEDPRPELRARLGELLAAPLEGRALPTVLLPVLSYISGATDEPWSAELMDRLDGHPDAWVRAASPLISGQSHENSGEVELAREANARGLELMRQVGDRLLLSVALSADGQLALTQDDLAGAEARFAESRETLSPFQDAGGEQLRLGLALADLRLRRGDAAGARELLEAAQLELPPADDHAGILRIGLAACDWLEHGPAAALDEALAALEHFRHRGLANPLEGHALAMAATSAASVAADAGRRPLAEELLAEAHAAAVGTRDQPIMAGVAVGAGWVAWSRGDLHGAAALLGAAERLRGAPDTTAPSSRRLRERLLADLGDEALARGVAAGRADDVQAAAARVAEEAGASDAAGVGA